MGLGCNELSKAAASRALWYHVDDVSYAKPLELCTHGRGERKTGQNSPQLNSDAKPWSENGR